MPLCLNRLRLFVSELKLQETKMHDHGHSVKSLKRLANPEAGSRETMLVLNGFNMNSNRSGGS